MRAVRTGVVAGVVAALAALLPFGSAGGLAEAEDAAGAPWFEDVTEASGVDFVHVRARERRFWLPEIMSGGAAWLDYDGDGDLDLYLVQSGELADPAAGATDPEPADAVAAGNRLYRNDGRHRFVDVTGAAGVGDRGYGMGTAVGDYDGDGHADLFVANVGPDRLFRNLGDGTFRDATAEAGVGHPGWGTSAAFVDFDLDGDLDLFVVQYIHWSPAVEIDCTSAGGAPDYCHPTNYNAPAADLLYENLGDGTFAAAAEDAGLAGEFGNGLGVAVGDFDGDGRPDLYVANDGTPNQLWLNRGAGRFDNEALIAGAAVNLGGMAEAGMGVAAGDVDGDGDLDLYVTHLREETNTFYRNEGGLFADDTAIRGLGAPAIGRTGFGVGFVDFDHDGRLDLFVANGRVVGGQRSFDPVDPFAEPDQLLRGAAGGRFEQVAGAVPGEPGNSRAAAFGDVDNDGAVDVLVASNGGRPRLLRNRAGAGHWLGVDVTGPAPVAGTRVRLLAGGAAAWRQLEGAYSYCAANDPRARFGLGDATGVEELLVLAPGGRAWRYGPLPADRLLRLYDAPARR